MNHKNIDILDQGSKEDPSKQNITEPEEEQPLMLEFFYFLLIPHSLKKIKRSVVPTLNLKDRLMDTAQREYISMVDNFQKLLDVQDIYSCTLTDKMISPNQLHERFKAKVQLIHTTLEERITEEIEKGQKNLRTQFYIKGPIGIGKSHALLAKALKLRKKHEENLVIYINNPSAWRSQKYLYFVKEIMYAMIPFQAEFIDSPDKLKIEVPETPRTEDVLFQWYYLLIYACLWPNIQDKEQLQVRVLANFLEHIKSFASFRDLKIYFLSDQENLFQNPKKSAFTQGDFPFHLRFDYGDYQILTASATNDTTNIRSRIPSVEVFERLTGTQEAFFELIF